MFLLIGNVSIQIILMNNGCLNFNFVILPFPDDKDDNTNNDDDDDESNYTNNCTTDIICIVGNMYIILKTTS